MQPAQLAIRSLGNLSSLAQIRCISCSPSLSYIQKWRKPKGLPMNPNAYGVLTDGSDFSYVDGRPTPYSVGQRTRMLQQKEIADKIIELSGEVDFALDRHAKVEEQKRLERQKMIDSKLKPKGLLLLKKS